MKNDLSNPGSIAEHAYTPVPRGRDAIRIALRDLKALLPAGSTADVIDAAMAARSEALEHLDALTRPDGLVDDLRWSCPWLMPRAEALLEGWRALISGLSELLEAIREGRHRRPRDRAVIDDLKRRTAEVERLFTEEADLMFELFNDPPALD